MHQGTSYSIFSILMCVSHMPMSATNIYAVRVGTVRDRVSRILWFFLFLEENSFILLKILNCTSAANSCSHKFCSFNGHSKCNILGGYFWLRSKTYHKIFSSYSWAHSLAGFGQKWSGGHNIMGQDFSA